MNTQATVPPEVTAPRLRKVLVAMAFEPTSDAALFEGMGLAARDATVELHLVHATSDADTESAETALQTRIEAAWQANGPLKITAHVRTGDPADAILQTAVDIDADLIVVGSHRRTGLRKLVLPSVAEHILQRAHCPVLLAVPKDYSGLVPTPQMDPPCEDCLRTRAESADERLWCERHSRAYLEPHVYVPREEPVGRKSLMF